ncbi:Uncharacterized protein TCM_019580 [Theobroma cacao]|uniref:Uncharacterized protein n=1 Tax=Theobroma cacao TaxID=3641 RepID=A0A061EIR3_THECC|nr:Uncharacterized protein TCM_019580 [Theobroma cacao]
MMSDQLCYNSRKASSSILRPLTVMMPIPRPTRGKSKGKVQIAARGMGSSVTTTLVMSSALTLAAAISMVQSIPAAASSVLFTFNGSV